MQSNATNPAHKPQKPARPPRWRDLTDEERWAQIYKGREKRRKAAPKTVLQAVGLALPSYCLHMAVADCHATFQATIRHDVHTAIVSGVAKVSALLQAGHRPAMATLLQSEYDRVRRSGFYLHNREFLYAISHATVVLADDWRYPADSPACMAALMLKEDAETDEQGDWSLDKRHAITMAGVAYNALTESGLYAYPEETMRRIEKG